MQDQNQKQTKIQDPSNKKKSASEIFSVVASHPNSRIVILVLGVLGVLFVIYLAFWKNTKVIKPKSKQSITEAARTVQQQANLVPNSPPEADYYRPSDKIQAPLALQVPTPPPPPAPPPPPPAPPPLPPAQKSSTPTAGSGQPIITTAAEKPTIFGRSKDDQAESQRLAAKMQASIMVTSQSKNTDALGVGSPPQKGFLGFDDGAIQSASIEQTGAANSVATFIGQLDRMILQGKIVDAVLETAINTDLQGPARAIVTRDVYAEYGKNILIPKGSRLVGDYSSAPSAGQTRVSITWSRLITPYGIDLQIQSPASDPLGRAGIAGDVDTKLWDKMANSFMVSYIIPYITSLMAGNGQVSNQSTTNSDGSTTYSNQGTVAQMTMQQASSDFSQVAKDALNGTFSMTPTIRIDQGTKIDVLIQTDLTFPADAVQLMQKMSGK